MFERQFNNQIFLLSKIFIKRHFKKPFGFQISIQFFSHVEHNEVYKQVALHSEGSLYYNYWLAWQSLMSVPQIVGHVLEKTL